MTFRLAGFPDLSVDSVFALGAVVFTRVLGVGAPVPVAVLAAATAGALAGAVTATMADKLRINAILASVLMQTILFSVNLRLLGGPNRSLYLLTSTLFSQDWFVVVVTALAALVFVAVYAFFRTELGSAVRVTGGSPAFLTSVGRSVAMYRLGLVSCASALVSAAGSLLAGRYGFADVSMGAGVIIIGIASIIVGEKICGQKSLLRQLAAAPIGILAYQFAAGLALAIGFYPTDVKLATGVITIGLLATRRTEGSNLLA